MPRPLLTAATLLLLAGAALAAQPSRQPARNPGDGRALDGGLSATGDRYNTKTRDITAMIRFNEAVVSGNAPGGKSFRSGTSLNSTSQFRGALGGSGSYAFERDAAMSGAAARGIRTSNALDYVFRVQTGGYNQYNLDAVFAPRNPLSVGSTARNIRSASAVDSTSARLPTVMGYARDAAGREEAVTASPLGGLRRNPLLSDGGLTGMERTAPGITAPIDLMETRRSEGADNRLDGRLDKPVGVPSAPNPLDTRIDPATGAPYRRVIDDYKTNAPPARPVIGPDGRPLPPGIGFDGQPIKPGFGPDGKPLPADGRTAPTTPAPGSPDATQQWLKDLDTLRETLRRRDPAPPANDPLRGPGLTPPPEGTQPKRPGQTGVADMPGADPLKRMSPRLDNLVDDNPATLDLYARLMKRGQESIAAGRYFDAEEAYSQALSARRDDMMARVGKLHAQMGAGLFLSAGATMRSLFTDHPELVPVKYAHTAIMTRAWANGQAQRLITEINRPTGAMADEAGMLLAYLGFQFDEPLWLEQGITAMNIRFRPGGPATAALVELVGTVWRARAGAAPSVPAPTPAPAAPAPAPSLAPAAPQK